MIGDVLVIGNLVFGFSVLFLIFTLNWLLTTHKRWRQLPPGPNGLPILGYLPFIKGDFHENLTDLSQQYGKIFSVRLGQELFVVLSDHKLIREAFRKEEFCARPENTFSKILDGLGKLLMTYILLYIFMFLLNRLVK